MSCILVSIKITALGRKAQRKKLLIEIGRPAETKDQR